MKPIPKQTERLATQLARPGVQAVRGLLVRLWGVLRRRGRG